MSFDTDYPRRKDRRRPYLGCNSMEADRTCRPGGSCPHCREGRMHKHRRREPAPDPAKGEPDPEPLWRAMFFDEQSPC